MIITIEIRDREDVSKSTQPKLMHPVKIICADYWDGIIVDGTTRNTYCRNYSDLPSEVEKTVECYGAIKEAKVRLNEHT